MQQRGDEWSRLIDTYIDVTNRILRRAPKEMAIGMHLCRGNRGGQWHAEGSYEEVAERLFNALEIPFYLPRVRFPARRQLPAAAAGAEATSTSCSAWYRPSRRTSKTIDHLRRRVDEADRFVAVARLAVSPQCGFASVETGNPLTPAEQEAKLRLVVDLAREVWGEA